MQEIWDVLNKIDILFGIFAGIVLIFNAWAWLRTGSRKKEYRDPHISSQTIQINKVKHSFYSIIIRSIGIVTFTNHRYNEIIYDDKSHIQAIILIALISVINTLYLFFIENGVLIEFKVLLGLPFIILLIFYGICTIFSILTKLAGAAMYNSNLRYNQVFGMLGYCLTPFLLNFVVPVKGLTQFWVFACYFWAVREMYHLNIRQVMDILFVVFFAAFLIKWTIEQVLA